MLVATCAYGVRPAVWLPCLQFGSVHGLVRAFNYQNGVRVVYKAFYNRLAPIGLTTFMRRIFARLVGERLRMRARKASTRRLEKTGGA